MTTKKKVSSCRLGRSPLDSHATRMNESVLNGDTGSARPEIFDDQVLRFETASLLDGIAATLRCQMMVLELAPAAFQRIQSSVQACSAWQTMGLDILDHRPLLDADDYKHFQLACVHLGESGAHLKILLTRFKCEYDRLVAVLGKENVRSHFLSFHDHFLSQSDYVGSSWAVLLLLLKTVGIDLIASVAKEDGSQ